MVGIEVADNQRAPLQPQEKPIRKQLIQYQEEGNEEEMLKRAIEESLKQLELDKKRLSSQDKENTQQPDLQK